MNVKLKMHYLSGGEKWFGSKGDVYTLTRKGYPQACPNAAKLLGNLKFTLDMENTIMAEVVDKKISFDEAAKAWVKAHPELLDGWLAGVTTKVDGNALEAVKAKL
ncbi:Glycine betaine-binding protein OpuAC precursor [compost metagenome]